MQRIFKFKYGDIGNTSLIPNKELNVLIRPILITFLCHHIQEL